MSRPTEPTRGGARPAAAAAIRAAGPSDARALAALMATIYAEGRWFVGDMGPRAETLSRQLRAIDPAREIVLVAEAAGDLVGWIEVRRYLPTRMEHVATLTI